MFNIFKKKNDDDRHYDDRLIIFDDEKQTASIDYVDDASDGKVTVVGRATVPIEDCEIVNGEVDGVVVRLYFLRAPTKIIDATANLAALEKSIVLKQLTDYSDPDSNQKGLDWTKLALFGLLAIAIVLGMSSCGA